MALTKPAGVFLQLLGACVLFVGVGAVFEAPGWGVVLLALGGWCMWQGRKPARRA